MRTILFFTLTAILASACLNNGQTGDAKNAPPTPGPTDIPANTEQQGGSFTISTDVFYQATVQLPSTQGQVISLSLTPAHKAEMVTNHKDNTQGTIDTGAWTTLNNGNLLLNLKRVGQKDSLRLEFKTDGDKLIYTGDAYGAGGLTLWIRPVVETK